MNCPNCNSPVAPNQQFCARCGTKLQPAADFETEKNVAANPTEMPAPEAAPRQAENASPWSFPAGNWQPPAAPADGQPAVPANEPPAAPPFGEQPAAPMYGQPAPPAYEPPAAPAYQPPQNNYAQQYQQYQQPSQFAGTQPVYQQGYNNPVAVAQKKGFSVKLLIVIIAAVLVVAGAVVGGIFLFKGCTGAPSGSYKDAVNGVFAMFNDGKYEEAIKKYSFNDNYTMSESERQVISMLSGFKYTVQINDSNSRVYPKGSSEFNAHVEKFSGDSGKQSRITEIAVVDTKLTITGSLFGQNYNESTDLTMYLACVDGEWKLPSVSSFMPN